MDQVSYKTTYVNKATTQKEWVLIDAENEVLGRLASKVAKLLRGKYKPTYSPHVDCGDQRHTSPAAVLKAHPERVIEHAVRGMLPKNRLGRAVLKNLYLNAGTAHKHEAQQPKVIDLNSLK